MKRELGLIMHWAESSEEWAAKAVGNSGLGRKGERGGGSSEGREQ